MSTLSLSIFLFLFVVAFSDDPNSGRLNVDGYLDFLYSSQIRINSDRAVVVQNIPLPHPSVGADSFAFDLSGNGPYTGVADGRILVYKGPDIGFINYAVTSPTWSKASCVDLVALGATCGRPLGLGFHHLTGDLYVADAYHGLLVVRPDGGGLGTQLSTTANGLSFAFLDGLDVDQYSGAVYFTDASATYGIHQIGEIISTGDSSGRLLKYEPQKKDVTVLLSGLAVPAGVALSTDRSFVLVSELMAATIKKYWLSGPKANTVETIFNLTGSPGKIKITTSGDFWVAVTVPPPSFKLIAYKIDGVGNILETVSVSPGFNASLITEVQEHNGALYLGSLDVGHVGVYRSPLSNYD